MASRLFVAVLVLLACTSGALAGELSDSLVFGDTREEAAHDVQGGYAETITALVGTVTESTPCRTASGPNSSLQLRLRKQPGQAFTLQIQEVYPPQSPGVRYYYNVEVDGTRVYAREYVGLMCGTVSYFVNVDNPAVLASSEITLKFTNIRAGSAFRISGVWLFSDFPAYCQSSDLNVPFYLNPLLNQYSVKSQLESEFSYLRNNVAPIVNPHVRLGCAQEHYYMHKTAWQSQQQFRWLLEFAKKYDMPWAPLFVSWWGGTPLSISDGLGGTFGDPKYQQVCWSETDTYDEGSTLRTLLGDKWDLRYGWTIPNIWSNTPWLTMNSPVLNNARATAIGSKLTTLKSVLVDPVYAGCDKYLLGITMENEPRYWDWHCPDQNYPVARQSLWGDFNPMTVADAAEDGVTLDPSDGLSYAERMWLHTNVANYQQETYDAHASALRGLSMPFASSPADSLWHEVYSHAFPSPVFPMDQVSTYHPGLEWNRLRGCRAGIEDVAYPAVFYLEKAREWGRWSQVNYEENNGLTTDVHLRALRVCHAFGARFYTFYNWQTINANSAWINYVRAFCADTSRRLVVEEVAQAEAAFLIGTFRENTLSFPASAGYFNEIELTVDRPGDYILQVYDDLLRGRLLAYRVKNVPAAGLARFDLPNCVPVDQWRNPYGVLTRTDGGSFGVLANPNGKPVCKIYADSARERIQSLMVCWRADAQALIADLKSRKMPDRELAEQFYAAGDYRRAYEAAASIDAAYPNGVPDIVIDNDQTGYTSTESWNLIQNSTAYGGSCRTKSTTQIPSGTAIWRPTIQAPGHYDVFIWYAQGWTRSLAAPFTIHHRSGSTTVTVNQTTGGGQWLKIASEMPFLAGNSGCVVLDSGTGENLRYVAADAVKFQYVSALDLTSPTIHSVTATPAMVAAEDLVQVRVDATDNVDVVSVTANGAALTKGPDGAWSGSIAAGSEPGPHAVTVVCLDAEGNSSTDTGTSYLTASIIGLPNKSLLSDSAVQMAAGTYLFRAWGSVVAVEGDCFTLSDGSSTPIDVCCPGHGLTPGDFAVASGRWEVTSTVKVLNCQPSHVQKQE